MFRMLGVILAWGGCILFGDRAARSARRRVKVLEDIGQALELLERELCLNHTALPELLEHLSNCNTGQGREIFTVCKRLLERGESFLRAWEYALQEGGLNRDDRELLCSLSRVLGRYDTHGQGEVLSRIRQEVCHRCVRQREEVKNLALVYRMLGITVGGFLALMLV